MTTRKHFLTGGVVASVAALLVPKASAQSDGGEAAPEIEGTWRVVLGPSRFSLQTYWRGGAVLENNSIRGTGQLGTTGHGTWARVAPHRYTKTIEWFTQPTEMLILRVELRELIEVTGDVFVIVSAETKRYYLEGGLERQRCEPAGGIGTRITPELPACP